MFYPDSCADSVHDMDWEYLAKTKRGVIFDIDNTLALHGEPADTRTVELFERLRGLGMETCLLSNNKEPRVASFAGQVKSRYIYKADKPSRKGYRRAMELMGTTAEETLFVGDQLFTDVWGAKRTGVESVLVKPINPKEEIQIRLKRYPERLVLYFYRTSHKENDKRGKQDEN